MALFSTIKCASEVRVKRDKQSEDAGYPKSQGGVFWQVSCRCTYCGVVNANILGKRISFRKPWAPALDFSCQCGRQEDNQLYVCSCKCSPIYLYAGLLTDASPYVLSCPDRFFPFVFGWGETTLKTEDSRCVAFKVDI